MSSKRKLTAALFQEQYGKLVSEYFSQYQTARKLRVVLAQRDPPIIVTDGVLKVWFTKYHPASHQAVSTEPNGQLTDGGVRIRGSATKRLTKRPAASQKRSKRRRNTGEMWMPNSFFSDPGGIHWAVKTLYESSYT